MSQKGVSEFIGNLITDSEFRKKFKDDPDGAMKGFDLTADERTSLAKLKDKDIGSMSAKDIAGALAGGWQGQNILADA